MADTNETIADIITWLRRPREGENETLWLDEIADRIEAAIKRKRGDAAKWRAALEKIAHYDDSDYSMDDPGCADGHICADIARKALADLGEVLDE